MNKNTIRFRRFAGMAIRAAFVTAVVVAPLMAVQSVRAGSSPFIGETPTMSNGAGFVIFVSLQRS